jgi:hypothetical protein
MLKVGLAWRVGVGERWIAAVETGGDGVEGVTKSGVVFSAIFLSSASVMAVSSWVSGGDQRTTAC